MKNRSQKQEDLDKLKGKFATVSTVILSTFQGITVEDDNKLRRAVEVFKQTQEEKRSLEREIEKLKSSSKEGSKSHTALERELQALRREREEVRSRIQKLIEQIDLLTKADSAG